MRSGDDRRQVEMDKLNDIAQEALEALEARHRVREGALELSRRLIRHSANTIRTVHRGEFEQAREMLEEGREVVEQFTADVGDEQSIYGAGYVQDALKEYVEASITFALMAQEDLPGPGDLGVDYPAYLNGLAEAMGELRRSILDLIRRGELERAEELLRIMDDVYGILVTVDYPDAITRGLRRTTDMVRGVLERTRGDLTMAVRQQRLEATLRRFEGRVVDRFGEE
jgi:translin